MKPRPSRGFLLILTMNSQREKALGIIALVGVIITSILLFVVKPEKLGDPITIEYLLKVILYPSVLILLRAIWKILLDNKIQSKASREADFNKKRSAYENDKMEDK